MVNVILRICLLVMTFLFGMIVGVQQLNHNANSVQKDALTMEDEKPNDIKPDTIREAKKGTKVSTPLSTTGHVISRMVTDISRDVIKGATFLF